jgi:glycosyltransferase involved in cell wall biosynthesis
MITILMPVYNGIEFFTESLQSILLQTFTDWELIIGINGHEENSNTFKFVTQVLSRYPQFSNKIKLLDFPNLSGKAVTLNAMLECSKYDYISLLDVDDIWETNKLQCQIQYITNYDVVGTQCVYFNNEHEILSGPHLPTENFTNFNFKLYNPIINSSSIIRKHLCWWDNTINGVEDYDLWLRLNKRGCTFYNCLEILVKRRLHSNSSFNSKGNSSMLQELLRRY